MSRIRSTHPGIWTDERFVSVQPLARLFFMGLWNECDDAGSFEWSPLKLKMRLLPADHADAAELLAELEGAGQVMSYELDGKRYGAVRNFCRYQRPKKPNSTYPQTDEVRDWVSTGARSTRNGSEAVGNQLPTRGEKPRQRKEGGGRKEVPLSNDNGDSSDDPGKNLFDEGVRLLVSKGRAEPTARAIIAKFQKDFGDGPTLAALNRSRTATDPVSAMRSHLGKAKAQGEYLGV